MSVMPSTIAVVGAGVVFLTLCISLVLESSKHFKFVVLVSVGACHSNESYLCIPHEHRRCCVEHHSSNSSSLELQLAESFRESRWKKLRVTQLYAPSTLLVKKKT